MNFNQIFHYKPSILGVFLLVLETPIKGVYGADKKKGGFACSMLGKLYCIRNQGKVVTAQMTRGSNEENTPELTWVFPNIGVPENGWFIMKNLIKMDDLGGFPIFLETPT